MIAITIPAYNEEKTIGAVISGIRKAMRGSRFRVLVVDDGSTDGTAEAARKAGATVFRHPKNYGLAEAFRTCVSRSLGMKADVIVNIDADGQYRPSEIRALVEPIIRGNADLVLGSRFMGEIEEMPLMKRVGNRLFSRVISGIAGMRITDGQTGFRAFSRELAEAVEIKSTHTYTQEQIIRAVMEKFRIIEIPIHFDRRRGGSSRLMRSPFHYAARAWINILRVYRDYKPLKFFGGIGTGLFSGGFLIGLYFLYLHLFGEGIGGHTGLLFLMLILIFTGIQVVLFGFLADMWKR